MRFAGLGWLVCRYSVRLVGGRFVGCDCLWLRRVAFVTGCVAVTFAAWGFAVAACWRVTWIGVRFVSGFGVV